MPVSTISANTTLTVDDVLAGTLSLNITAAVDIDLPAPVEDIEPVYIFNVGTNTGTFKRSGATVRSLPNGQFFTLLTYMDSSGVVQWAATSAAAY